MPYSLVVDDSGNFRDGKNRVITLRGVNLDGSSKLPASPPITTYTPVDENDPNDPFWDGDNVSFVGRPLSLEEAPKHLERIRSWGYNTIRYLYSWEAVEHSGPGVYDNEFIDYSIEVMKLIKSYGFYIILDPHQDVWGRFSGGSGAPLWTYYAVGLDPKYFTITNAAFVQNLYPKEEGGPENFPKMFWATNYYRFVCQLVFTVFFAGKDFAPNAIINGKNIQDYLQDCLLNASIYFYKEIARKAPELFEIDEKLGGGIFASESVNEPHPGLIGFKDIGVIPKEQNLKLGPCPTAFQSMLLASGHEQTVEFYEFGGLGPKRAGTKTVDPKGSTVWLKDDSYDQKYGWTRGENWKLGECLWSQHGVWDKNELKLLKPHYFSLDKNGTKIDKEYFVNNYFVEFWKKFYEVHRKELGNDLYLLCQPPVLAIPPKLKGTRYIDERVVYAPHFYDGITLMLKHWSKYWNIDCLGYLRGRYSSPFFAIRFGEKNIRKCLQEQLIEMKKEGFKYLGESIASIMTETGIPFDMDNKKAYSDGDYDSQESALDATNAAIEASAFNVAFWGYTASNTHKFGDSWNGEDFSMWSNDSNSGEASRNIDSKKSTSTISIANIDHEQDQDDSASAITRVNTVSVSADNSSPRTIGSSETIRPQPRDYSGLRAIEAVLRPFPISVVGRIISYSFELKNVKFKLVLDPEHPKSNTKNTPTEIFVPEYHYPIEDRVVQVSSGTWTYNRENQILSWWHTDIDEQTIEITSLVTKASGGYCHIM